MDIIPSPQLKQVIMHRVWTIWFVRRVLPWLVFETAAVWFVLSKVAEHVFVNRVLQNAVVHTFSRSPLELPSYFVRAFFNTEVLVQALMIGLLAAAIFLARDLVRASSALVEARKVFFQAL